MQEKLKKSQSRRDFIKLFGCGFLAAAGGSLFAGCQEESRIEGVAGSSSGKVSPRPNMVLIVVDDQRQDMLSCLGNRYVKTPNLDRIGAGGCVFENSFCTSGTCSPSRSSFLTGKHPHQAGSPGIVWHNHTFLRNEHSFALDLQRAGYHTAHFGKWHLGAGQKPQPGYDHWAGFEWLGDFYNTKVTVNGVPQKFEGFSDDILSNLAAEHISKVAGGDKPFFIYIGLKAPHLPFCYPKRYGNYLNNVTIEKPESYNEDYDVSGKAEVMKSNAIKIDGRHGIDMFGSWDAYVKSYYRASQALDDAAGTVFKAIENSGVVDDTVFIYSSDQGYSLGEHGLTEKHYAYESVMRIPMIVHYPRMIKGGIRPKEMAANIDVAPTLLDLAGVEVSSDVAGISWVPLLKARSRGHEPEKWRDELLFKQESPGAAIPGQIAVRTDRYKLITYQSFDDIELYDLKKDPGEVRNVAGDPVYAEVLEKMKARLARLKRETNLRPYVNMHLNKIYLAGPMSIKDADALEDRVVNSYFETWQLFTNGGKRYKWQTRGRESKAGFGLSFEQDAGQEVFIGFKINVLDARDPYTRLIIAPAPTGHLYRGFCNGEDTWHSKKGAINHYNPPLKAGDNFIVLRTSRAGLESLNILINAPKGSISIE
jgi:N-acetylglucosamine-6-sulfatase